MSGINIVGTGGIIEGTTNDVDVNVDLDSVLEFDGVNDKITVPDNNTLDIVGDITLSAWVKITMGESDFKTIISKSPSLNNTKSPWQLRIDDSDKVEFVTGNGTSSTRVSSTNAIKEGWNHIAVTVDENGASSVVKYFINGVLDRTVSSGWTDYSGYTNTDDLLIGVLGTGYFHDGYLADVRIYNAVVDDPDVAILASRINVDPLLTTAGTTNLQGWWKLNNNSVTDSSPNTNNGTASGPTEAFDQFHVDILNNNAGGSGTFKVTQGKVEGKALTSIDFEDTQDYGKIAFASTITQSHDNMSIACWIKKENATGNDDTILGKSDLPHHHYLKIGTNGKIIYKQYPQTLDTSGDPVNDTEWHHIVVTLKGDNNGAIYLDGRAQTLGNNSVIADGTFDQIGLRGDSGDGEATANEMDGLIRDVRFYDFALSAEQAASLCANTLPITPKHHYKLDEGSGGNGDTVADTGTGTTNNGTLGPAGHAPNWSNGTLTLDGTLTIGESNDSSVEATISAPRGILHLTADLQSFGAITHNNGTFKLDNGSSMHTYNVAGGANQRELTFHNLTMEGTGGDGYRIGASITIENDWIINGTRTSVSNNAGGGHNSGVVVTLGTTTSAGSVTINSGKELETYTYANSHSVTYQGVSPAYPALFTNNGTFEETLGSLLETVPEVKFGNMKFALPFATRPEDGQAGGGSKITLIGDCEFDDLTLTLGDDELHTDGHRLQAVDFTVQGSSTLDWEDSLCVFSGHVDLNGNITTANSDTKIIHNTSAEKNWRSLYADAGVFFANGTQTTMTGYQWASSGNEPIKVIAGSIFNTNSLKVNCTDLTIANGGNFSGSTNTHSIAGDFTTSGGIIGKSGMTFDGTNDEVDFAHPASTDLTGAFTIEGWFKPDATSLQAVVGKVNFGSAGTKEYGLGINGGKWFFKCCSASDSNNISSDVTFTTGKWYHVAVTKDSSGVMKMYVDGKLQQDSRTVAGDCNGAHNFRMGRRTNNTDFYYDGDIARTSIWSAALTPAQIRTLMFQDYDAVSTTNLNAWWQFDTGSGTTVFDSTSNNVDGTIDGAAWIGAGTFTCGSSTIDMTGNGTWTYQGTIQFHNFKVAAASKTTTYKRLSNGTIYIKNNLYIGAGTFTRSSSVTWGLGYDTYAGSAVNTGTGTILSGATDPINFSSSYVVYFHDLAGTFNANTKFEYLITSNPLTLTNSLETTGYLWASNYTIDIADQTCTTPQLRMNDSANAKVTMSNGTLNLTSTNQAVGFEPNFPSNTFTAGPGATISGPSGSGRANFTSQPNFVVVGKVEKLNVTNEELSVTGQVINCTGEIHQQFPTIDHDQQLDFDTADDRDIILGRDLDKNTELINS